MPETVGETQRKKSWSNCFYQHPQTLMDNLLARPRARALAPSFARPRAPMSPVLSDIALEIALEDGYTSLAIVTGAEDRDRAMSDDPLLLVGGTGALLPSLSALLTVPPPYLDSDGSDDDEHKVEREGRSDPPSPALSDDGFDVYAADGRDY
jgi:hypothetical protein